MEGFDVIFWFFFVVVAIISIANAKKLERTKVWDDTAAADSFDETEGTEEFDGTANIEGTDREVYYPSADEPVYTAAPASEPCSYDNHHGHLGYADPLTAGRLDKITYDNLARAIESKKTYAEMQDTLEKYQFSLSSEDYFRLNDHIERLRAKRKLY